jgi:hypothetical protein
MNLMNKIKFVLQYFFHFVKSYGAAAPRIFKAKVKTVSLKSLIVDI